MGHISPPSSPPPWFRLPTSFAQVIASNTVIPSGLPSFPFLPIVKSQLSTGTPWNPSQLTSFLFSDTTNGCPRWEAADMTTSLSTGPPAGGRQYFQPIEHWVALWLSLVSRMWWMGLASSEHEFWGVLSFSALLLEPCTCPAQAGVLGGGDGWAKNCWKRPSRPVNCQSTYQQRCPDAIRANVAFWNLPNGLQMQKPRTCLFKVIKMFLVCYIVEIYW